MYRLHCNYLISNYFIITVIISQSVPPVRDVNCMPFHSKALGLGIRFPAKLIDLRKRKQGCGANLTKLSMFYFQPSEDVQKKICKL